MRYGLIGEKLGHSFSKIIHEQLADYTYDLIPLTKEELHDFMTQKAFSALNVTIPYKEAVMPYLDEIDEKAAKIGAVNTIVNRSGKLYGYNTDYHGFRYLMQHHHIDAAGKKVLILGKGGACKAVSAVLEDMGASEILLVYYKHAENTITYADCYANHADAQIIVNTTPVGMYPQITESPIDLSRFSCLEAVVDVFYNPLRTKLVLHGLEQGCTSIGGLEMLVGQAKYAVEIFRGISLQEETIEELCQTILEEQRNIVLIGMSGCGKSTIGKLVADKLGKTFVDTDIKIIEKIGMSIADYFAVYGEASFREIETQVIQELAGERGLVISTGGGVVKDPYNLSLLKLNGHIIWIHRDLELLESGEGRPLAPDAEATRKLYAERLPLYTAAAESIAENNGTEKDGVCAVLTAFQKMNQSAAKPPVSFV